MAEQTSLSVFITGADQGAGLALTRLLVKRGHKVTGTTHTSVGAAAIRQAGGVPAYPSLDRVDDVRGLLLACQAQILVHCAPQILNQVPQVKLDLPQALRELNSADELMIAAGKSGVQRLIYPSFAFLYGDTHGEVVDESFRSSRSHELFMAAGAAEAAVLDGGIPGYVLRCGYVYGSTSPALQALKRDLELGNAIPGGKNAACWLHEEDLAAALLLFVERGADDSTAEVFNAVDDAPVSPDEFAKEFGMALGVGEPNKINPLLHNFRTSEIQRILLETSVKASNARLKDLGWKPQYPNRASGFERTLMLWRAATAPESPQEVIPERAIVTL